MGSVPGSMPVDGQVLPLPTTEQLMEFSRLIAEENDLFNQLYIRNLTLVVPKDHWLARATSLYGKPVVTADVTEPMWAVRFR